MLSAFTSEERPPGLAVGGGARCVFSLGVGSVLAFSAVFFLLFSLVSFPLFVVLGLCGSSFLFVLCVERHANVDSSLLGL